MGLDMYAYRKAYVKNWEHMQPEELHEITVRRGGKVRKDIKPPRIGYIEEEVGYTMRQAIEEKFILDVLKNYVH